MLEELIEIHQEVIALTPRKVRRYLYDLLNWKAKAICITGDRGVGKTTMICQYLIQAYQTVEKALYISADNITVTGLGLFAIAREFFTHGGEALFIDEVHKYPDWSIEIKNILDTYKNRQVVFTASSSLDLKQSKADLSRRVVYHRLMGLSFREYLILSGVLESPAYPLTEIIENHLRIAEKLKPFSLLKYFRDYLKYGYYPFFLEGIEDYFSKVNNVIEKVIFEDIAVVFNLKQTTLPILKKLLWLVATSDGLTPNIDRISSQLSVSREVIYNCFEYLAQAGLLNNIYSAGSGLKMVRKPGKVLFDNSNLIYSINGTLRRDGRIGGARETFFANQIVAQHSLQLHNKGDFIVDDTHIFEIGGRGKDAKQIQGLKNAYLVKDDIEIGYKNQIPLYLFGFLY